MRLKVDMALTKEDLQSIKGIVVDVVDDKIDDLATSIQKEFAAQNDRFTKIDDRFDKIDDRFDKIDDRFSKVDDRFDRLRSELKSDIVNVRDELKLDIAGIKSVVKDIKKDILRLEIEIAEIHKLLNQERERTVSDIDILRKKVFNLEKEVNLIKSECSKLKTA
ncbi:MAG: hypothetical protein WC536_03500 [Patescibacteria group bacterium]